ncbi:hypothetical protein WJX81_008142 [Elliptochloris bilobata]|uniref:Uncharacterized protein n=1 Tax=Elliptochloris bilobata TaxID=381761 RepID=A0AAW1QYB5_9CHLO
MRAATPRPSAPGSKGAASTSAFLEPGAVLAALPCLEALYAAAAQQHSSLLTSFSAVQSANQLIRVTAAELAMGYRASHGEAALLHTKLISFLSEPFLAARQDDEGAAASHMQLLFDLCHGEQWHAAARLCSEILLHTHDKAPEATAIVLMEFGTSALRALRVTKAKPSTLEADMSVLHAFALACADCAHEVATMCSEVVHASLHNDKSTICKHGMDILVADLHFYAPENFQQLAAPHIRCLASCLQNKDATVRMRALSSLQALADGLWAAEAAACPDADSFIKLLTSPLVDRLVDKSQLVRRKALQAVDALSKHAPHTDGPALEAARHLVNALLPNLLAVVSAPPDTTLASDNARQSVLDILAGLPETLCRAALEVTFCLPHAKRTARRLLSAERSRLTALGAVPAEAVEHDGHEAVQAAAMNSLGQLAALSEPLSQCYSPVVASVLQLPHADLKQPPQSADPVPG